VFVSETLKTHFETSSTIQSESLILSEWNMNMPDNIFTVGNYRYRPNGSDVKYRNLPIIFDPSDSGNYYTGATDADTIIDGGYQNDGTPQLFTSTKEKMKTLYSLEECLMPFRPRSGINKMLYFNNKFLANSGKNLAKRPRYYMASKDDEFKYWTSYRTEDNSERGISNKVINDLNYIEDAVPFVVYNNPIPTNRVVIKMQTNVGDIDQGTFNNGSALFADPFYGDTNKTTPSRWKIQYLKDNNWIDLYSFNENSLRDDGTSVIGSNGYVEMHYGLIIPEEFKNTFIFAETLSSATLLPEKAINGYAYLIIENSNTKGTFYIWNGSENQYSTFTPNYGWILGSETITTNTNFVTDLTSSDYFNDDTSGEKIYREFSYIKGMRIVVETMNKLGCSFDLIEMSPRLVVNISEKVIDFTVKKSLSDLGSTALPVGQLLVSTGTISMFDNDQSFNINNESSIVSQYLRKNIKFNFYEKIVNVSGYDYFVPIKTLYSDGFPQADRTAGTVSLDLRDFYSYFESTTAPRILVTQVSLSYAISLLLDYIGFSNYVFYRTTVETDPIIPYFFIAPDINVAEVLNQLAISTQSAMFFDEYNNFVVMSKDYLLPSTTERTTDLVLSGSNNQFSDGIIENQTSGTLPNILSIASEDKKIYNDGKINYTTRYIQRSYGTIRQASMIDKDKTWVYKPALLWEVAGTENTKTINEIAAKQGSYVLGAMPLNSDITDQPPYVENHILKNNVIDFGENIYWLTRYTGYFYANGEIVQYDAAQFNITGVGNVWISSNQEYQNYFSSLPFNGKIYPTGLVRIACTPYYETVDGNTRLKNGVVESNGRSQFGTPIAYHSAGLNEYWSNNDYVRACNMKTEYLFTTKLQEDLTASLPSTTIGAAGIDSAVARQTTRNSIIKDFMAINYATETQVNNFKSTQSGTIQSSALVMNGPAFSTTQTPINYISYVYKNLNNAYKHFGTRMRIIGNIGSTGAQSPVGSTTYYQIAGTTPDQNINLGGGSGGLAILLNPETNNGYYFEIAALTENNVSTYLNTNAQGQSAISLNNVVFYKIKKNASDSSAIPVKLWGGLTSILVDDGRFTGQYRMTGEDNPTVYDLSVEYQDIGKTRRFYLYINNKLIQVVDDVDPLPTYNNMAPFVRGSSRVMFENIYAISQNYSQNTTFTVAETLSSVFGDSSINVNDSFRKYAMSGIVSSTYLSGISGQQPPKYNMYFEEFGTIMRECAYFNIKYDRAWPALYAKLSPTFNRIKGYTVSGFYADSYGAEFLIFNSTDTALNLDDTTGNYLRIQGITFTQDTTHSLTTDDYFNKSGNMYESSFKGTSQIGSALTETEKFNEIKLSRMTYGTNSFTIETPYIQTDDDANSLMGWIINKLMKPKRSIGVKVFANPMIQLGDIVTIDYKNEDGINLVTSNDSRFVVYNIDYSKNLNGPDMTLYLSEV
jgi:hypothetical protein